MKKLLIAVPCMDTIPLGFVESLLKLNIPWTFDIKFMPCSLVYTARDRLAQIAVAGYEYIMFIDSDMVFEPEAIKKLMDRNKDIVTAVCYKRKDDHAPCIYKNVSPRLPNSAPTAEGIRDFPSDFFEVDGCGMAFCLIRSAALKEIFNRSISCFEPYPGLGEDLSFCYRAKHYGFQIWADTTVPIGHIGTRIYGAEDFVK